MSLSAATRQTSGHMAGPKECNEPPKIFAQLQASADSVEEGEPLQLVLEISKDGDNNVEWFKDAQLLNAGSRFNTSIDRGVASLELFYTYPEDSGSYYCRVSNRFGQVQCDPVQITVMAEQVSNVEDSFQEQFSSFQDANQEPDAREARNKPKESPTFLQQLSCHSNQVTEGEGNRFEATINISSDSTLSIEWMKDGKPLGTGSRFNVTSDRGLLSLEIAYCFHEDSGEYVCVAKNALGEASSNPIQFECLSEDKVVTKSILGESSIQSLKALEDPGELFGGILDTSAIDPETAPSFRGSLSPSEVEVAEDGSVEFTAPVDTGSGSVLTLEWFKDGALVKYGSRINGSLELGLAALKIKYATPDDSGAYTCQVRSEHGMVESSPGQLLCQLEGTINTASQLPGDQVRGIQAIEDLEAVLNAPRGYEYDDDEPMPCPSISTQPQAIGELAADSAVHLEAVVEPALDPELSVEWFKDDKALVSGTRFRVEYDRGLAVLDLLYSIQEDTGHYWCKVTNRAGEVESERVEIKCSSSAQVVTESNLIQGSDGYKLIQAIEDNSSDEPQYNYDEEVADMAPVFDVRPTAVIISEGGNAKFLVRLSGKPTPEVEWTINEEAIKTDSITKVYNDGAITYLEISRFPFEHGVYNIKIVASNPLGSTEASTVLTVSPSEDFRPDLKHIQPNNPFKRMVGLRKVAVSDELVKALGKAKPSAQTIMNMERGTEMKARSYKSPDVIEAENLLDKMAVNLRRSDMNKAMNGTEQ